MYDPRFTSSLSRRIPDSFPVPYTLSDQCPQSSTNSRCRITLKIHQERMLYAMEQFENEWIVIDDEYRFRTKMGVIADKVGSGKSFCILALLCKYPRILNPSPTTISQNRSNVFQSVLRYTENVLPVNVVVVPHGIFHQWKDYFQQYTDLTVFHIQRRKHMDDLLTESSLVVFDVGELMKYEVILVSSSMFGEFAHNDIWVNYSCERLIVDEIDTIQCPSCPYINASRGSVTNFQSRFTWYITATFKELCFSCYRIASHIRQKFGSAFCSKFVILKNDDHLIDQSFHLPPMVVQDILCRNRSVDILHDIVSPEVFQSMCAGDIETAITVLGCQKICPSVPHSMPQDHSEHHPPLIDIVCQKLSIELKNLLLEKNMIEQKVFLQESQREEQLQKVEDKINVVETKRKLIEDRLNEQSIDPISIEEIETPVITKCCQNKFDIRSILELMKHRRSLHPPCPYCRTPLTRDQYILIVPLKGDSGTTTANNETTNQLKMNASHDKYDNLRLWFLNHFDTHRKILIFAEYDMSLDQLSTLFDGLSIPFQRLCGTSSSIELMLNKFKNGECPVLLLNARFFGAGLNLQMTTDVILLHRLHSENYEQVIGRCQRPGRDAPLHVWKFMYPTEGGGERERGN